MSDRYPDFIIGGAPKCGTTSLHFILDQHPEIALPEDEIHFFDADDPVTHPDFFFAQRGALSYYDVESPEFRARYAARFAPFVDVRLIGEDSTTYIMSPAAPGRIRDLLPNTRMIFMLRDPVARAYSQYWHSVTRARATRTFEKAIAADPGLTIGSTYLPGLERYRAMLGADRVKAVLFEDFIADQQCVVDDVTDFLGAARMALTPEKSWFNRTAYPTWLRGQLALNRVGRRVAALRYRNHLDARGGVRTWAEGRIHYHWFRRINPLLLKAERQPAMKTETRDYLTAHYSRRNQGLSDFLGRDLSLVWKGFTG